MTGYKGATTRDEEAAIPARYTKIEPVIESSPAKEAPSEAAEVGAAAPPTDVDTTGSSSEYVPQLVTTAPEDWAQNPYVQIEGGFLGGLMLGHRADGLCR